LLQVHTYRCIGEKEACFQHDSITVLDYHIYKTCFI
jgi:hypothetical protein